MKDKIPSWEELIHESRSKNKQNWKCKFGKHEWETVDQGNSTATYGNLFGTRREADMVVFLQKCKNCPKERAFGKTATNVEYFDADYIKAKFAEGKE